MVAAGRVVSRYKEIYPVEMVGNGVAGMGLFSMADGYWSNMLSLIAKAWSGFRQGILHGPACSGISKSLLATK